MRTTRTLRIPKWQTTERSWMEPDVLASCDFRRRGECWSEDITGPSYCEVHTTVKGTLLSHCMVFQANLQSCATASVAARLDALSRIRGQFLKSKYDEMNNCQITKASPRLVL